MMQLHNKKKKSHLYLWIKRNERISYKRFKIAIIDESIDMAVNKEILHLNLIFWIALNFLNTLS